MWLTSNKFTLPIQHFKRSTKINPFYINIIINNEWEDLSDQSDPVDPVLWRLLTGKNAREFNNSDEIDSDDDIDGNDKVKERELKESSLPFPAIMYNIDGPNISSSEIVNIAPGEGQILFLLLWNLIGKHLHFLKTIPQEETTLTKKEKLQ